MELFLTKLADFTTSMGAVWYYMVMFTIVIIVGIANHEAHACEGVPLYPETVEISIDIRP